ncbi:MAG: E3 binding domain-containing protein, partial [Planctomycetes bacterium]|nr:E3 binding domain-containing protein [Planctomycetota bacterium]
MALKEFKLPDIGEGIAEVELVEWNVKRGDTVAADQVLASLMTDKAAVEVPSPVAGIIVATTGSPGDKLAVGSELLRIETEATVPATPGAALPPAAVRQDAADAPAAVRQDTADAPAAAQRDGAPPPAFVATSALDKPLASPSVRRHARELGVELAGVRGTGPDGRVLHDDVVRHAARVPGSPAAPDVTPPAATRRVT